MVRCRRAFGLRRSVLHLAVVRRPTDVPRKFNDPVRPKDIKEGRFESPTPDAARWVKVISPLHHEQQHVKKALARGGSHLLKRLNTSQ